MAYYLGFDGGGTKTESVLLDNEGQILAQAVAGPSNPLRIGFEQAFAALNTAADSILSSARIDARQVTAVGAGLAGAGSRRVVKRVLGFLVETFPNADVHVATDLEVALEAAVGPDPGVVLVAGTGSAAFGRNAAGHTVRAGGHGPWVGDEGSAFDIGRRAVAAVARARDHLAPVTLLADLIPAALECSNWQALIERIAEAPDEVFPRIFPLVIEAAEAGDAPANEILFTASLGLAQLAGSVVRRLHLEESEFVLAKSGGVFGHSQTFESALDALLHSAAPKARVTTLAVAPAVGAARLAVRLSGAVTRRATYGAKA
jgi:N-acetylglucosamine kinase-like BadF-type ATPase